MPFQRPSSTFFFPASASVYTWLSMSFQCLSRKGRRRLLQNLRERSERGCSRRSVTAMRKIMQKNLLKNSRSRGVMSSAREKRTQQLRQRMSSYLSVVQRARQERKAGMRQQTRLVSSEWVLRKGLSTSSRMKRTMAAWLGLRPYFQGTNLRAGNWSRAVSWRGSMNLLSSDIYWKILQINRLQRGREGVLHWPNGCFAKIVIQLQQSRPKG